MMANNFTEETEISQIYKFVEAVVKFIYKNKTIEGYLKTKKDDDSQEIDFEYPNYENQIN